MFEISFTFCQTFRRVSKVFHILLYSSYMFEISFSFMYTSQAMVKKCVKILIYVLYML